MPIKTVHESAGDFLSCRQELGSARNRYHCVARDEGSRMVLHLLQLHHCDNSSADSWDYFIYLGDMPRVVCGCITRV